MNATPSIIHARPPLGTSLQEIREGLITYYQRWLGRNDLQFEVRTLLKTGGPRGKFFNLDVQGILEAAKFVLKEDGLPDVKGLYCTLNPAPRGIRIDKLTSDKHILGGDNSCYWILLDVDPMRPNEFGTWNATEEEFTQAFEAGKEILKMLPLTPSATAISGNGFQACFPVAKVSKDEHNRILQWLDGKTQDAPGIRGMVKVDTAVSNPARIWRIPGTHGRKDGNGIDRPNVVKAALIHVAPGGGAALEAIIADNQRALEALLVKINAEKKNKAPKITYSARSGAEVTQRPSKKGASQIKRAIAYADTLAAVKPAISGQAGHNTTFANLCKLFQNFTGLTDGERWEVACRLNEAGCIPPWNESELRHKIADAMKAPAYHAPLEDSPAKVVDHSEPLPSPPAAPFVVGSAFPLVEDPSDRGNAHRLLERHEADIRYVANWGKWLLWDKVCWKIDFEHDVERYFKESTEAYLAQALDWLETHKEHATKERGKDSTPAQLEYKRIDRLANFLKQSRNAGKMAAALTSCQSETVTIIHDRLNRKKDLVVVENGTVDLATGMLRESAREDLLTQRITTPFDFDAVCPRWMEFLNQIFIHEDTRQTDYELIAYVQKMLGCAITGRATRENIFPICVGSGGNGKSVFLGTIQRILGDDICLSCDPGFLMEARATQHQTSIASVFGKRLILAVEPPAGSRMNTALVKGLTGGDKVTARRMREDEWQFEPEALFILCTNELPQVRETSDGVWRRVRLIEFLAKFDESSRDTHLQQKLLEEAPGILAWLIAGAKAYLAEGIQTPDRVMAAVARYRDSEDIVGGWLDECAQVFDDKSVRIRASALQENFKEYCERNGFRHSKKLLSDGLQRRGVASLRCNGTWYLGISLNQTES